MKPAKPAPPVGRQDNKVYGIGGRQQQDDRDPTSRYPRATIQLRPLFPQQ